MVSHARYEFDAGSVIVLSDGMTEFPSEFLLIGVNEADRLAACQRWAMNPSAVDSSINVVYINTGGTEILFDTGAGATMPGCGRLNCAMQEAGISPNSIDHVIHTHAHLDHLGWNVDSDGKPFFTNAHYLIGETELEFWSNPETHSALNRGELWHLPDFEPAMSAVARSHLLSLGDRLKSFADDGVPVPGVKAIPAFGHTPGHLAFTVDLGNEQLVISGDLVLSPFHLDRSDWYPGVDLYPPMAMESRKRVLNAAADNGSLVAGYHLPFPGIGRIEKTVDGWSWHQYNGEET